MIHLLLMVTPGEINILYCVDNLFIVSTIHILGVGQSVSFKYEIGGSVWEERPLLTNLKVTERHSSYACRELPLSLSKASPCMLWISGKRWSKASHFLSTSLMGHRQNISSSALERVDHTLVCKTGWKIVIKNPTTRKHDDKHFHLHIPILVISHSFNVRLEWIFY